MKTAMPMRSVEQVAAWLTQFFTDHSLTGSGLDRITDLIMADVGLPMKTLEADIAGGADAANSINQLIKDGLAAVGALGRRQSFHRRCDRPQCLDPRRCHTIRPVSSNCMAMTRTDRRPATTWSRTTAPQPASSARTWSTPWPTAIYHIGFQIVDGRFRNEDGDANATVSDVADWLNYFLSDASSYGHRTGPHRRHHQGRRRTCPQLPAADIDGGAGAANALNALILEGIAATGAMADSWITSTDLEAINAWLRADPMRLARFIELHGDDENGSETGYHLVQNDGANTNYFGQNLVNTVADGIYHIGFTIENGRFLNEDGDANATLAERGQLAQLFHQGFHPGGRCRCRVVC
jgi:hypothetical protein